jgi:undecaprenyl-diphosphatase
MSVQSLFWVADGLFSVDPLIEVQRAIGTEWEPVVRAITLLGDSRLILVLGIALFWYVARHRPYQVLAASLLGAGLGSLIKLLVERPRPALNSTLAEASGYSFPSGHTLHYTAFWGFVSYLLFSRLRGRWLRFGPIGMVGALIGLVGPSRVYLGHHWLTDVLASYCLGTGYLMGLIGLHRRRDDR